VAEPIVVDAAVTVPAAALAVRAVRSSGPGGQNVNKVASKVELRVELDRVEGLDEAARARLLRLAAGRTDAEGRLLVTSQKTRDQGRNLEDARGKVRDLVARALVEPRRRRATRPGASAHRARLEAKKARGAVKRRRGPVRGED
jgi:ribosome-associated protein